MIGSPAYRPCMLPPTLLGLLIASTAAAQSPAPPPIWKQGMPASMANSTLAPLPLPPIPTALDKIPVDKLKLPAGFKAEIWSHGLAGGRTMVVGPKGSVFVGTRAIGRVYAITEKDGKRDVKILLQGLTQPNGLAINRVLRYDNIEDKLDNPGDPVDLTDKFGLPPEVHHNWKYAAFGPDGKLYIQIGAPCNICEINPGVHAQIRRYNADGSGMEIVARGVRNTVGFDWHPVTKELWFTDHGRDWMGNDGPQDELNRIAKGQEGANFGYPYCHANGVPDADIRRPNPCAGVVLPAALTGPHAAGLGIMFYTGDMFPANYKNAAFIARKGSWNRDKKFGFDVVVARTQPNGTARIEPFMSGLLDESKDEYYGRPAYVLPMADGALLVSDEHNGAIYRISYSAPTASAQRGRKK
jgi:glucose/arabinose dehydrogenase